MICIWDTVIIVMWCPVNIANVRLNYMHNLIYISCFYSCPIVVKGVSLPMCLLLGSVIWSGPVLMIVNKRFVGSFVLNILSRSTI